MKKLPFVCPICGGRLLVCWFETGSTDYIVSKNGKPYKNPIRKASSNLGPIEDARLICCENVYNRSCDFATNCDLEFDNSPKYDRNFKIIQSDTGYKLYDLEVDDESNMEHKTTIEEAILISKVISISGKIDYANHKDFEESKTFEKYEKRRGIIDIDEKEFNFLKNPKLKEEIEDND